MKKSGIFSEEDKNRDVFSCRFEFDDLKSQECIDERTEYDEVQILSDPNMTQSDLDLATSSPINFQTCGT